MEIHLTVATGCNVHLIVNETKQYFATEGYPDGYKNNQDCHFNFEAPPGRRIVVFFEDFDLEIEFDFLHFRKLHTLLKHSSLLHIIQNNSTHWHTHTHTDTHTPTHTHTHIHF